MYFKTIYTNEKTYWIGFLYAETYMETKNKKGENEHV